MAGKKFCLLLFFLMILGLSGNSLGLSKDRGLTTYEEQEPNGGYPPLVLVDTWEDIGKKMDAFKKKLKQFSEELKKVPESDEYRELQEELAHLSKEAGRLGTRAREKLEKDVLPQIKDEVERLRELLQELNPRENSDPVKRDHEELLPV